MEIKIIQACHVSRTYKKMLQSIYCKDPYFKNNKQGLIDVVCNPKGHFYQNSKQQMVVVTQDKTMLCLGVLILHNKSPKDLSVAFFEALPNASKAVAFLMDYAKKYGKTHKATKMIIGLDGHCNHGLGFCVHTKGYPSFGEAYTPSYYLDYFNDYDKQMYVSYEDRVDQVSQVVLTYMDKMAKRRLDYILETSDFSRQGYCQTMKRYTDLNNEIFQTHDYYFPREYDEDRELFQSMKPLLDNHNLIFIKKDKKDIGFILWYFDYNELVQPGKGAGVSTFIRYRLLKQRPRKVKIVEIGVLPEYQGSPAILYLFKEVMVLGKKMNPSVEQLISSWIYEKNTPSRLVTSKFAKLAYRTYVIYETNL